MSGALVSRTVAVTSGDSEVRRIECKASAPGDDGMRSTSDRTNLSSGGMVLSSETTDVPSKAVYVSVLFSSSDVEVHIPSDSLSFSSFELVDADLSGTCKSLGISGFCGKISRHMLTLIFRVFCVF